MNSKRPLPRALTVLVANLGLVSNPSAITKVIERAAQATR
jgi:hypothetical protein